MTETQWLDVFGDNLKSLLQDRGMTQSDLANAIGTDARTINRYISKQRIPTIKNLINIAYALDCTLDELTDFGDNIT